MVLKYMAMESARPVTLTGLWITIVWAESIQLTHSLLTLKILMCGYAIGWQRSRPKISCRSTLKNPVPTVSIQVCCYLMKVTIYCSTRMYLLTNWLIAVWLCSQLPMAGQCMDTAPRSLTSISWSVRSMEYWAPSVLVVLMSVCRWPTPTKWYRFLMDTHLPIVLCWQISCWVMVHCYSNKACCLLNWKTVT